LIFDVTLIISLLDIFFFALRYFHAYFIISLLLIQITPMLLLPPLPLSLYIFFFIDAFRLRRHCQIFFLFSSFDY